MIPRSERGVIKIKTGLIAFSLVATALLGGCASTSTTFLPNDLIGYYTTDYRFKSVMNSNDDVRGWANDALKTINELEYQLNLERNK
jgi:uncharacterized protein YceK